MNTTLINRCIRVVCAAFCILHASLFLSSCSKDDYLGGHATTDGMGTLMNVTATIKAQTNPGLTWNSGDVIGIATGYGLYDVSAKNRQYVCQEDGATFKNVSGYPIYVKGNTTIVAYYPYTGVDGAEVALTLNTTDQDHVTDYLFAKAEGVSPENGSHVNLVFDYALTQLTLSITAPAGETITSYRLQGFSQVATVDPFTHELTLEAPVDLTGAGSDIKNITLKLIPQTLAADAAVAPRLILVGSNRSYSIDMSQTPMTAGVASTANINVTDGIGNIEFVPGGSQWTDSGIGGSVSSE